MRPTAIPYFGVALFLALVFLAKWKRRHDAVARVKKGLDCYLAGQQNPDSGPNRDILKRLDRVRQ